jgi:hypothetical protein
MHSILYFIKGPIAPVSLGWDALMGVHSLVALSPPSRGIAERANHKHKKAETTIQLYEIKARAPSNDPSNAQHNHSRPAQESALTFVVASHGIPCKPL